MTERLRLEQNRADLDARMRKWESYYNNEIPFLPVHTFQITDDIHIANGGTSFPESKNNYYIELPIISGKKYSIMRNSNTPDLLQIYENDLENHEEKYVTYYVHETKIIKRFLHGQSEELNEEETNTLTRNVWKAYASEPTNSQTGTTTK